MAIGSYKEKQVVADQGRKITARLPEIVADELDAMANRFGVGREEILTTALVPFLFGVPRSALDELEAGTLLPEPE